MGVLGRISGCSYSFTRQGKILVTGSVSCSVAVIHYLSPGCLFHGSLQRVDFLCAVGLWVSSGRYIPLLGAILRSGGVKRVVGLILWSIVRRWDDSTQSLAQVRFRSSFFLFFIV